jgi:hypothetical protein
MRRVFLDFSNPAMLPTSKIGIQFQLVGGSDKVGAAGHNLDFFIDGENDSGQSLFLFNDFVLKVT